MPASGLRWGSVRSACRHALLALAALVVLGAAPAPARAQWLSPWRVLEDMHTPPLGARQLRRYAQMLQLSPEQKAAADELLAGYEREFRALAKRMQEVQKSIQEEYENEEEIDVWREVWPRVLKSYSKKSTTLNKTLLDDLKVLLEPAQLPGWERVERQHRRETALRLGSRSWEQVDLVELVDGLRLDPAELASGLEVLDRYAIDLDRELSARAAYMEENTDRFFDMWSNWDEEKIKKVFAEANEFSERIVGVNRRYATQVRDALPPARQAEFDAKVKMASFPRVYKQTYTHRVLDAADALPDLDPGQREAIKGIRESYERDAATINDRWAAALADMEQKQAANPDVWGWWGGGDDERAAEARAQRRQLELKTVDSLKALLTPAQREKLPDRKWKQEFDLDAPSPR